MLNKLFTSTANKEAQELHVELKELQLEHKLEMKEKEFELKHFKDDEMKERDESIQELRIDIATLEKENEMLKQIVDLNADLIDVKELIGTLITKLPEVKISNLTVGNGNEK